MYNGYPLFRKLDHRDIWLLMTIKNTWMICTSTNKERNEASGYCCSSSRHRDADPPALPSDVSKYVCVCVDVDVMRICMHI